MPPACGRGAFAAPTAGERASSAPAPTRRGPAPPVVSAAVRAPAVSPPVSGPAGPAAGNLPSAAARASAFVPSRTAPYGPLRPAPAVLPERGGGPGRRQPDGRLTGAAGLCLVLGAGLLGGAAAGHWLGGDPAAASTPQAATAQAYANARDLWHDVPVDTLFPR